MTGLLGSWTSLPNLHPALVHFPVALAFTALALELVSLACPRWIWLERSAAALYGLAAAGAVAAYLAGRQAADTVGAISARAEIVLSNHADLGLWTMIVLLIAGILRVAASVRGSRPPAARFGAMRAVAMVTLLGAVILVAKTADLGGALVFEHGVAVTAPGTRPAETPSPPAPAVIEAPPEARLSRGEDGSLVWRPAGGDGAALGTVLTPLPEGSRATVGVAPASTGEPGEGLELIVDGESFLALPGTFDDLVAEARLDLAGFKGTVGLGHHAASPDAAVLLTVTTAGEARLTRRAGGRETTLDTASIPPPNGVIELRTTAAGNHLKGFIDGKMVVHGHGRPGEQGRVGLYLNGQGAVRILSMSVQPATGH